jgi:hypothetical protein
MTDKRKPTFGASQPDPNPIGKNAWRDTHSGKWSAAKIHGAGQSDPYIGGYIMPAELRDPGHRVDQTLPTPLPTKDVS